MRRLRRFSELTNSERLLLLRALFVVGVARLALWVLPVDTARNIVAAAAGKTGKTIDRSTWAVRIASQYVPRATCLTQALAVQAFLTRSGHEASIEIGVAKGDSGFEAHAWVICEERVVIGGPDVTRYERLTTWSPRSNKSEEAFT